MIERSKQQKEANEIDMEMNRLASRIECFAKDLANSQDDSRIDQIACHIETSRYVIRRYMHPTDIEATQ